jgi:hypothetical protein
VTYAPTTPARPGAQVPAAVTGPTLLFAPYPNPASRGASLHFRLAQAGRVELELFDLAGHKVRRLLSETLPAGEHAREWDGRDERGSRAGSGLYVARLRCSGVESVRKVCLVP